MAVTGTLVFAVLAAALSSFLFGYNIGVINAPRVIVAQWIRGVQCARENGSVSSNSTNIWCKEYGSNETEKMFDDNRQLNTLWSLVSSIFCAGALLSAVSSTVFVNRFGRRGTLLINNMTAVIGSVFLFIPYFIGSYELLIVGRFVIGLNAGLNSGVPPMYLTEIAPPELRGAIGTVHQLVCVVGVFISQVLGLPQILGNASGWPYLFAFSLVPAIIQVGTLLICPESPRHLYLNRHDTDGAKKALEFFQANATIADEMDSMEEEYLLSKDQPKVSIPDLFRNRFLRGTIFICMMVMLSQQFSGINAVMFYSTQIFEEAGLNGIKAQYGTIGMGAIFVVATVGSMSIMEKAGRRSLLLAGLGGMMITSILLVVFMKLMQFGYVWAQYLSFVSVLVYVVTFAIGPGPIPWFIASELFAQAPRAAAVSVVAGVNWISTLLITFTFPLIEKELSEYTFLIFTGFLVGFIIFTFFRVPETKGKRIDEIQAELRQRL